MILANKVDLVEEDLKQRDVSTDDGRTLAAVITLLLSVTDK